MNSLVLWMNRRKAVTVVGSAIYFAAVMLLHEEVSKVSVWLQKSLTLRVYNLVITVFSIAVIVLVVVSGLAKLRRSRDWALKVFYLSFAFVAAAISYNTLIVSNIEAIHFPQYAFLVPPIFALTLSFSETLLSVSLLGAFDEAYQYFILKNWSYLDFNDIVLNVIGGCIGMALLFLFLDREKFVPSQARGILTSPAFVTIIGLLLSAVVLNADGLLRIYPPHDGSKAFILLSKKPPPSHFWVTFKWGKRYHVLSPAEGLALSGLLIACYTVMDRKTVS